MSDIKQPTYPKDVTIAAPYQRSGVIEARKIAVQAAAADGAGDRPIVPLYAAPQDRVVRLPKSQARVNRYAPGGVDYIEGWSMGVADAKRAMDAAGVKWEVRDE